MADEISHGLIARDILKKYPIKFWGQKHYVYGSDDGKSGYVLVGHQILKKDIQKIFNNLRERTNAVQEIRTSFINEVIAYIEREGYITDQEINNDLIYVNNGILDTSSCELIENTPDIFVPIRIPVTFDPDAKCPAIDAFLRDITTDKSGKTKYDENDLLTLYEMFGYLLDPGYSIRKACMLTGGGHNGKTTYYNVMTDFCGKNNISRVSLYDFSNRFASSELHNKLVNIKPDLGHDKLNGHARGMLKELTGGEREIMAEKKRRDHFYFFSRAKMYFGANEPPSSNTIDRAFIERWVIIELNNEYPDDPKFLQSLTTKEELSGLLNRALEALKRLRRQRYFSKTKSQGYRQLYDIFDRARIRDRRIVKSEDILKLPMSKG